MRANKIYDVEEKGNDFPVISRTTFFLRKAKQKGKETKGKKAK